MEVSLKKGKIRPQIQEKMGKRIKKVWQTNPGKEFTLKIHDFAFSVKHRKNYCFFDWLML